MEKRQARRLTALTVVALVLFGPGLHDFIRLSLKQRRLERELRQLEALHRQLVAEEERLKSDPVYVEGLIRSTFKVAKPGELVVPLESEPSNHKTR